MRIHVAAALFFSPALAIAQTATSTSDILARSADDRWTLGAAVSVRDSPYAGEGTRTRPLPLLTYSGERLFWNGLSGGVHAVRGERFGLDVILAGRFDGFDIDDLGRSALIRNGLDPALLEDRDDGLDAGLAFSWFGRAGQLKLHALADITDASGGHEFGADYAYAMRWGSTTIVPGIGVRWMSRDLVRYYYGILEEEVARGVAAYRPGSAVVPQVSIGFSRSLGEKWRLVGAVDYRFLPDEITDSPLIEPDTSGSAGLRIGLTRGF